MLQISLHLLEIKLFNSTTNSLKQKGERFSAISIELYGK